MTDKQDKPENEAIVVVHDYDSARPPTPRKRKPVDSEAADKVSATHPDDGEGDGE